MQDQSCRGQRHRHRLITRSRANARCPLAAVSARCCQQSDKKEAQKLRRMSPLTRWFLPFSDARSLVPGLCVLVPLFNAFKWSEQPGCSFWVRKAPFMAPCSMPPLLSSDLQRQGWPEVSLHQPPAHLILRVVRFTIWQGSIQAWFFGPIMALLWPLKTEIPVASIAMAAVQMPPRGSRFPLSGTRKVK